jgi:hypothetical protein
MKWQPTITSDLTTEADMELVPSWSYPSILVGTGVAGNGFLTVVGNASTNVPINSAISIDGNPVYYASAIAYDAGSNTTTITIGSDTIQTSFTSVNVYAYSTPLSSDSNMLAKKLHLAMQNLKQEIGERFEVSAQDTLGPSHLFRGNLDTDTAGMHVASQVGFVGKAASQLSLNWTTSSVPKNCIQYWEDPTSTYVELYIGGADLPIVGANHSSFADVATATNHSQYMSLSTGSSASKDIYIANLYKTSVDRGSSFPSDPLGVVHSSLSLASAHGNGVVPIADSYYPISKYNGSVTQLGTAKVTEAVTRYVLNVFDSTYSSSTIADISNISKYMLMPSTAYTTQVNTAKSGILTYSRYYNGSGYVQIPIIMNNVPWISGPVLNTNIAIGEDILYGYAYQNNIVTVPSCTISFSISNADYNPFSAPIIGTPINSVYPDGSRQIFAVSVYPNSVGSQNGTIYFTLNGNSYTVGIATNNSFLVVADAGTTIHVNWDTNSTPPKVDAYLSLSTCSPDQSITVQRASKPVPAIYWNANTTFSAKYLQGVSSAS